MSKELDIGKTFDKLDQKNVSDLEEQLNNGAFSKGSTSVIMTSREKLITDMIIRFEQSQFRIISILESLQEEKSKKAA